MMADVFAIAAANNCKTLGAAPVLIMHHCSHSRCRKPITDRQSSRCIISSCSSSASSNDVARRVTVSGCSGRRD